MAFAGPAAAAAQRTRTQLPSDHAVSAYVGVSGEFCSRTKRDVNLKHEYCSDLSAYALYQPITKDNLDNYLIAEEPLSKDPQWRYFYPSGDAVNLVFDIADKKGRLRRIEIVDLATGQEVGRLKATKGRVLAQTPVCWENEGFRVTGYTGANERLFVLGVSLGNPDKVVPYWECRSFSPYRPQSGKSAFFPNAEKDAFGPIGNLFEGKTLELSNPGISRAVMVVDYVNDGLESTGLRTPYPFDAIRKRFLLTHPFVDTYDIQDPFRQEQMRKALAEASSEDHDMPLKAAAPPAFSKGAACWTIDLHGQVTSFWAIPYRVARQYRQFTKTGFDPLPQWVNQVVWKWNGPVTDLSETIVKRYKGWLETPKGKASGHVEGDLIARGDVASVTVSPEIQANVVAQPVYSDFTMEFKPDVPLPTAVKVFYRSASVKDEWPIGDPAPPIGSLLMNASGQAITGIKIGPDGIARATIAKGHWYSVTPSISVQWNTLCKIPPYAGVPTTFQVTEPTTKVTVPLKLQVLLELKVTTTGKDASGHEVPMAAEVELQKPNGAYYAGPATSTRNADGSYSVSFYGLEYAFYLAKVSAKGRADASYEVLAKIGPLQAETMSVGEILPAKKEAPAKRSPKKKG